MKKILLSVIVALFPFMGSAQIVSSTSRNITTTTTVVKKEKKTYFGIDASVGKMAYTVDYYDEKYSTGAFGLGFHWERHYNPYIAWDVFSVLWDAPFDSPSDFDRLAFKTGVRGFTPKFYRDMRGYANLDLGYSLLLLKDYYYDEDEMSTYHAFALEFGFGLRLTDHIGVGYALDWDSNSKYKGNYLRLNFLF